VAGTPSNSQPPGSAVVVPVVEGEGEVDAEGEVDVDGEGEGGVDVIGGVVVVSVIVHVLYGVPWRHDGIETSRRKKHCFA